MTIHDAISLVDCLKPNQYSDALKIQWLSKLDGQIFNEVFLSHEGCPADSFGGYDGEVSQTTALLAPPPYDEDLYSFFLQCSIDRENGETDKYNQSVALYNSAFANFQNYWNRTHLPLQSGQFRF